MLQGDCLSVLEAETREEFQARVIRFARHLGFDTVTAMVVVDSACGSSKFSSLGYVPSAYRGTYEDLGNGRADPVMQHCRVKSLPIVWDQSTYVNAGRGEKWEHQARFGYRCGISFAMHLPKGFHFLCGVDRSSPLPNCPSEVSRMTADLQLFAVHALETAMRTLLPQAHQDEEFAGLTSRELECLRWTMEGKTAWELGRILGIAEQTAVRHIHHAAKKLGCVNKHQAVLKVLRMRLIW